MWQWIKAEWRTNIFPWNVKLALDQREMRFKSCPQILEMAPFDHASTHDLTNVPWTMETNSLEHVTEELQCACDIMPLAICIMCHPQCNCCEESTAAEHYWCCNHCSTAMQPCFRGNSHIWGQKWYKWIVTNKSQTWVLSAVATVYEGYLTRKPLSIITEHESVRHWFLVISSLCPHEYL